MHRTRLILPLAGALAVAACAGDRPEVVAPTQPVRAEASAAVGRFVVLAGGTGFASDFGSRVAALGGAVESQHGGAGLAVVTGLAPTAATQLASISGVVAVTPDVEIALESPVAVTRADASAVQEDPSIQSQANPASAVLFSRQWNMRLIHAPAAWTAGKLGSAGVTVAILDSGIDYLALDLNGLVDLSRSKSFVPSDDQVVNTYFSSRDKITDLNGHGTNVATQVSSKAVAFAGVTSKTTLIGVKVTGQNGKGTLSGILSGVLWAADHGADVANMSLGGGFSKVASGSAVGFINRVFSYANQQGMLVVVAAGNEGADLDHDGNFSANFCGQTHVVCVSALGPAVATDNPETPSFFTNFGRSSIDVAGPGGNARVLADGSLAVSAWPWGNDIASWVFSLCSKTYVTGFATDGTPTAPCAGGNFVLGEVGTSQATPHVTGLAALLVAELGHGHPAQIKAAIEQSAVDLGPAGTDPYYGKGRIDVAKALGL